MSLALVLASGLLLGPGAIAAPTAHQHAAAEASAKMAALTPIRPAAADDLADCSRSRKRLWLAGEGWVVRKVTICH